MVQSFQELKKDKQPSATAAHKLTPLLVGLCFVLFLPFEEELGKKVRKHHQ